MGTTAEKLTKLIETKEAIKQAIIGKGQAISDRDSFSSYADKIANIPTEAAIEDIATTEEMNALATSVNQGNMYRYIGETDTYTFGVLYIVEMYFDRGSYLYRMAPLANVVNSTVTQNSVLNGERFVNASGQELLGAIPNNGGASLNLTNIASLPIGISAGYYDGSGVIDIPPEMKSKIIPENIKESVEFLGVMGTHKGEKEEQEKTATENGEILPDVGKVLSRVIVNVPGIDVSDTTAEINEVLMGNYFYNSRGQRVEGEMINNGSANVDINSTIPISINAGYYNGLGQIRISQSEIDKLIPENIKSGVNILGTDGNLAEGFPIEISTAAEMDDLLIAENVGKSYKFVGTTDSTYINGDIYTIEESE